MFSKDIYIERRSVLKKNMGEGVLLFLGNVEMPMNFAENSFEFRQDSTFLYYFGISEPNLFGLIDVDEDKTILFGNELSMDEIIWMGRQETIHSKAKKVGIDDTKPIETIIEYLNSARKKGRNIHYLPTYTANQKNDLSRLNGENSTNLKPSIQFIKAVIEQRKSKQPVEIVEIERAVNVSNEMHLLAMKTAKAGMKEYELVSAISKLAADHNCRFSYPAIMTIHGQILHNHFTQNTLQKGDMILNDSGVETSMGYAGDLTRTFPVDEKFTSKQRDIYDIVLNAFEEAQSIMRPGLNFREVHRKAALVLVDGLKNLGLLKGNPEDAVENNVHTLFFQCGVGHMMGLDVHDMENLGEQFVGYTESDPKDTKTFGWKSLRLGRPLEEGFVVTVEPGIYMIPELIDNWQSEKKLDDFVNYDKVNEYRDFGGIRIEDDFLITRTGYKLLGNGLIKTVDEIEAFRAESLGV